MVMAEALVAGVCAAMSLCAPAPDPVVPVVVLGARLDPGCSLPGVLEDRLAVAERFANRHPESVIVVTGGPTQKGCPTEAEAMESSLRARGVVNPIVREDRAWSTAENARNTAALFPDSDVMVLISSRDHVARAGRLFQGHGIHTVALGA